MTVPWPGTSVTPESLAACLAVFHRQHEQLYTFSQEDTSVEIVTLRLTATGKLPRPSLPTIGPGPSLSAAKIGEQEVEAENGAALYPIYNRDKLGAGTVLPGPAIVQQLDATTLILPGQVAEVEPHGCLTLPAA